MLTLSQPSLVVCCVRLLLCISARPVLTEVPLSAMIFWVVDPETDGQAGGFPLVSSQLQDLSHQEGFGMEYWTDSVSP